MTFEEILDQAVAMLQRRGRLTYGTLKRQFQLDDAALEDLKNELIEGQRLAVDERGNVLVWTGAEVSTPHPTTSSASSQDHPPLAYTPVSGREGFTYPQRHGRRAQASHGTVRRPEGLNGTAGRP